MKTKKTRIISLLLALVMMLALVACGPAANNQNDNPGASSNPGTPGTPSDPGVSEEPIINDDGIEVYFENIDDSITVAAHEWWRGDITSYTTAQGSDTKKTPAGTLVFGTSGNIQGGYPPQNQNENIWCFNIYESLFVRNYQTGGFDPWLATGYEYDDAGNLHLYLREGVKFHDGNTMTAEDVLFSLKLSHDDPKARAHSIMLNVDFDNSEIIDDYHLKLAFHTPVGSIIDILGCSFTAIMSKDFVEKVGPDYPYLEADAGTGAYQLVETVTDISQTFKRFDDYWGGAPDVETVICKKYTDETVMFIDFLNGDLDFTFRVSIEDLTDILEGKYTDMTLFRVPVNRYKFIYFNTNDEGSPTTDVRVREAIAHAVNYEELAYTIYGSEAIATGQMSSNLMPGTTYYAEVGQYEYNPELSKQLLAEAGYSESNPCTLKLVCGSNNHLDEIGELLQYYCSEVGIDIQVDVLKSSALKDQKDGLMKDSDYDILVNTGDFGNGNPTGVLATRDKYGKAEGEYNPITGLQSQEFHDAFQAAEAAPTDEERAAIYKDIQQMFFDNVWQLNILMDNQMCAVHDWVENTTFTSGYTIRWANWSIAD